MPLVSICKEMIDNPDSSTFPVPTVYMGQLTIQNPLPKRGSTIIYVTLVAVVGHGELPLLGNPTCPTTFSKVAYLASSLGL